MTDPTTQAERAEIVRLRENTTVWNGPVTTTQNRDGWYQACGPELINRAAAERDAAYIVAACNLAPRLVADVARLEREKSELEETCVQWGRQAFEVTQRAERAESALCEAEQARKADRQEIERLREKRPPAFTTDYARMWDLVRHQRAPLADLNLISREEYALLLSEEMKDAPGQGSSSPRRLESYDEMAAKLREAERRLLAWERAVDEFMVTNWIGVYDKAEEPKATLHRCITGAMCQEHQEQIAALERQRDALREALKKFGKHLIECDAYQYAFDGTVILNELCDCGLAAALKETP